MGEEKSSEDDEVSFDDDDEMGVFLSLVAEGSLWVKTITLNINNRTELIFSSVHIILKSYHDKSTYQFYIFQKYKWPYTIRTDSNWRRWWWISLYYRELLRSSSLQLIDSSLFTSG